MNQKQKIYIADLDMLTPVGADIEMTAAAILADISAYRLSDYFTRKDQPVTMALVPDALFKSVDIDIDEGDFYGAQHERVIKMALIVLQQIFSRVDVKHPIPLILSFPEPLNHALCSYPEALITNILAGQAPAFRKELVRGLYRGRSGGIEAIDLASRYLIDQGHDYVLVGASDSFYQCPRLAELDESDRLLSAGNSDAFAPGEAAGFILLTSQPRLARKFGESIIEVCLPGVAEEPGHILGDEPCLGEGLDKAFKNAILNYTGTEIGSVYSSMNGERYWSKEYGVAMIRNKQHFHDDVAINHPADCYGDLGAATAPVLVGLAAMDLLRSTGPASSMIYCSSDNAARSALCLQKIPSNPGAAGGQV